VTTGIAGEVIYRVPSLSLPRADDDSAAAKSSDAVALLAGRARAKDVTVALDPGTIPTGRTRAALLSTRPANRMAPRKYFASTSRYGGTGWRSRSGSSEG
jgi:hypothetical protein